MQMREAEYWRGFSNARDAPMTGWKPVDYYSAPPSTAAAVMENWVDFSWILPINELRDKWESRVFFTCCSHRIGDTEWQNSMMQLLVAPASAYYRFWPIISGRWDCEYGPGTKNRQVAFMRKD